VANDLVLQAGERVVWRSKPGGPAGYSVWLWLLFIFAGMQVFGSFMSLIFIFATDIKAEAGFSSLLMPIGTLLVAVVFLVAYLRFKKGPAYFVTDRRFIARRFLNTPLIFDPREVVGAARFLVQYTRYGRVVNEILTHRVVVGLRSGGTFKFGPVEDADELVTILQGVGQGVLDLRTLAGVDGGLSRAEERSDLYFALTTTTGGAPRGPLFVGPTKVIGFAEVPFAARRYQILSIVGADRSAEEIEESVISLVRNPEWGRGRGVVMEREGLSINVEGSRLVIGSGPQSVAFDLTPQDAERAVKYLKANQGHPYRG
jgi:hypothetical protein